MPLYRPTARQLRLASGVVLLTYLSTHLATHMAGLASLAAAEAGLRVSMWVWHSVPGTAALYSAFSLHLALALRTLYMRRHWQLPAVEWLRLWAGFSLPLLLIGHVVSTRLAVARYDFEPSYGKVVTGLLASGSQGWQIALLAPGWVHGCLGLWLSLRHRAWARHLQQLLLGVLIAVPLLSAAGFVQMGRSIAAQGPVAVVPDPTRPPELGDWRRALLGGYLLLVTGAVFAGRWRSRTARPSTPESTEPDP